MKSLKRLLLASCVALSLSSCNMYKLAELRQTTPSGTPFQNELSRLYMDYATVAEKGYDWFNSWHFADKGLMLAYGKDMPPEDLKDWDIPKEDLPDMQRAREQLMEVLTADNMRVAPARTAEAQFYFDCWVKEQEENWREDEIANCHDNLIRALGDLHAPDSHVAAGELVSEKPVKKAKKAHKEAAKAEKSKEQTATEPQEAREPVPESTSYAVFFEPDKAEVSEPGMNVITEVIKSLHNVDDYVVILHSSKDHPGKAAERIAVIKKLLVAGGVKDSAIRVASGKTEVEAGKSASHRVEIFLNE